MLIMKWTSILWLLSEVLVVVLFASLADHLNIRSRYFMTNNILSVSYENQK